MCSLEPRAPRKNFGMSYLLTDGCDRKGGRKEVVVSDGRSETTRRSVAFPRRRQWIRFIAAGHGVATRVQNGLVRRIPTAGATTGVAKRTR